MGDCQSSDANKQSRFETIHEEAPSQELEEEDLHHPPQSCLLDQKLMRPKFISSLATTFSMIRAETGAAGALEQSQINGSIDEGFFLPGEFAPPRSLQSVTCSARESISGSAAVVVRPLIGRGRDLSTSKRKTKPLPKKASTMSVNKQEVSAENGRKKICLQVRGHGSTLFNSTTVCKLTYFENSSLKHTDSCNFSQ